MYMIKIHTAVNGSPNCSEEIYWIHPSEIFRVYKEVGKPYTHRIQVAKHDYNIFIKIMTPDLQEYLDNSHRSYNPLGITL